MVSSVYIFMKIRFLTSFCLSSGLLYPKYILFVVFSVFIFFQFIVLIDCSTSFNLKNLVLFYAVSFLDSFNDFFIDINLIYILYYILDYFYLFLKNSIF